MEEDINRLKVVLVEKRKRANGYPGNWELLSQPFQNGVPTPPSPILKP